MAGNLGNRALAFVLLHSSCFLLTDGSATWPTMFAYSPDNMPTVQIRMAPPDKPMPEVSAAISKLDTERTQLENEALRELESTFATSLEEGRERIHAMVDRVMESCRSLFLVKSKSPAVNQQNALKRSSSVAFLDLRGTRSQKPGGEEMTAKINLLPVVPPAPELERKLDSIETIRSMHEKNMFRQARSEMEGLTSIVVNEGEAQLTSHVNGILRLLQHSLVQRRLAHPNANMTGTSFMEFVKQPVISAGLQLATNVRVMASEAPFPTIEAMVEDMARRRDAGENLVKKRILEMELKLLQSENIILSDAVRASVAMLLTLIPKA